MGHLEVGDIGTVKQQISCEFTACKCAHRAGSPDRAAGHFSSVAHSCSDSQSIKVETKFKAQTEMRSQNTK